jgi:hypothetical protein
MLYSAEAKNSLNAMIKREKRGDNSSFGIYEFQSSGYLKSHNFTRVTVNSDFKGDIKK